MKESPMTNLVIVNRETKSSMSLWTGSSDFSTFSISALTCERKQKIKLSIRAEFRYPNIKNKKKITKNGATINQVLTTLPQKPMYLESRLSVFPCSYFFKISSFPSLKEVAGSLPTEQGKEYICKWKIQNYEKSCELMIKWRRKSLSVKRTWGVNKILNGDVIGDVKNDNGDGLRFPFSKCPIQSPVSIL